MMTRSGRSPHDSLAHRVTAAVSEGLFRHVAYTVRHGLLKGLKRKGGLGFLPEWFPGAASLSPEERFWRDRDLSGQVVWDVGAYEGLLTLHFARSAARVIAWEPHPKSRERLRENVALNRLANVTIRPVGAGREPGMLDLISDPLLPGEASGDPGIAERTRSALADAPALRIELVTLDADREQHDLPLPDLIKLDVEGMELQALLGAVQTLRAARPAVYLEMHGVSPEDKEARARAILDFLRGEGYRSVFHVESGTTIAQPASSAELVTAASGHLYCTR